MKGINPDIRIPHFYLLKSGFSAQDTVLIEGIQLVKQGQKIKSKFKPMRQLLNEYKEL